MTKKVISLMSDGIDSPVAAYLMMKKGFVPVFLTFITTEAQHKQMENKIQKIVERLKNFTSHQLKLYLIPHTTTLSRIIKKCPRKLTCILCKRLMYRIAMKIGDKEGTNVVLTGDILGEQASQTLSNLHSYHSLFEGYIKISPLIGMNKLDVTKINKEIGVYEICSQKLQSCQFFPQYPETNAKKPEINHAETLIDVNELIKASLDKAKVKTI
jgi:thiamine biosynthesis protein ThiI